MEKDNADVYVDDEGAIPEEGPLEDGYDADGEVDDSEQTTARTPTPATAGLSDLDGPLVSSPGPRLGVSRPPPGPE